MRVLILSHRDVVAALPPQACAESMAAVLAARARGETHMPLCEFQLAVREGAIAGAEHVRAELGEVLAGSAPGRRDDGELTLFRSPGIAVEDLAAAETAVAAARAHGLGTEVEL